MQLVQHYHRLICGSSLAASSDAKEYSHLRTNHSLFSAEASVTRHHHVLLLLPPPSCCCRCST